MAVEITILVVIEQLQKLLDGTKIVDRSLRTRVDQSIKMLKECQGILEGEDDDRRSPLTIDDRKVKLLKDVYLAEDTIVTFLTRLALQKQKGFIKAFPWIHFKSEYIKFRFSNKLKQFTDDLTVFKTITRPGPIFEQPFQQLTRICRTGNFDMKEVEKQLLETILVRDSSLLLMSMVAAGSGNTSLLRKIYDDVDIQKHFQWRAWVHVSENRNLLSDIMEQLTGIKAEYTLPLREIIRNFLSWKRYLVVLYDLPAPDNWEDIKFVFPNSFNSSRVILSFREADGAESIANAMYCGGIFSMEYTKEPSVRNSRRVGGGDGIEPIGPEVSDPNQHLTKRTSFYYLYEKENIVGFHSEMLQLAKLSRRSSSRKLLISVVGVAGSGKTTLVKKFYYYRRLFYTYRAWVYVPKVFEEKQILVQILKQVTKFKDEDKFSLEQLQKMLHDFLRWKRYLIVLDDVYTPAIWDKLKDAFPKSLNGSRVIITLRDPDLIAVGMDTSVSRLWISPLSDEESWILFLKKVRRSPPISGDDIFMELLREKILQKCGGLPLALCVLAGLLSTRKFSYDAWLEVIEDIQQKIKEDETKDEINPSGLLALSSDNQEIPDILALGYQDLPFPLRSCLLYICLFPKPYDEIPLRRLFSLWIAEELMKPLAVGETALEDLAESCFQELERRNIIEVKKRSLNGSPKTCCVPSALYDKLFLVAEKMGFFHIHSNSSPTSSASSKLEVRRLVEYRNIQSNPPSDEDFQQLRSYISFNSGKGDKPADEVGNFLKKTITKRGFGLLRLLDLEDVYKPVLPDTLGKLPLLRYVGLRGTFLDSIPESIGHIPCLETLDVKRTNISTMPTSIWEAKELRHLYMDGVRFEMSTHISISNRSLTKLQTLRGLLIGNSSRTIKWLKSLNALRKLGLTCHTASVRDITEWIHNDLKSLQSLKLRSIDNRREPSYLYLRALNRHEKLTELYLLGELQIAPPECISDVLPPNLRVLTLSLTKLSYDPMPMLGKLEHLNILRLLANSYVGEKMTCATGGFPKLQVLKLWMLNELTDWTIEERSMPALQELEIRCCQKLKKPVGLEKLTVQQIILAKMKQNFVAEVKGSIPKKTILS